MTLREKIADWVSGGALAEARGQKDGWRKLYLEAKADFVSQRGQDMRGWEVAAAALKALDEIIALETPNMAHVGKKAVAIAKKARGED